MSNEFLGFKVIVDDSQPPNVISITGASVAKVTAKLERLVTENAKLRAALMVADKALEHYATKSNWAWEALDESNDWGLDVLSRVFLPKEFLPKENGYEVAQQARTEIAGILEGK